MRCLRCPRDLHVISVSAGACCQCDPTEIDGRMCRYGHDRDDRSMEVSYQQMQAEERRSARAGRDADQAAEREEQRRIGREEGKKEAEESWRHRNLICCMRLAAAVAPATVTSPKWVNLEEQHHGQSSSLTLSVFHPPGGLNGLHLATVNSVYTQLQLL